MIAIYFSSLHQNNFFVGKAIHFRVVQYFYKCLLSKYSRSYLQTHARHRRQNIAVQLNYFDILVICEVMGLKFIAC